MQRVYLKPSFEELKNLAFELFKRIEQSGWKQDVNVGIGRGGLFVLRMLQDFYIAKGEKIPYIVIAVERYRGIGKGEDVKIRYLNSKFIRGRKVLLVDDVADQGISLREAKRACLEKGAEEVRVATIHLKPWSVVKPDFYVAETDAWIIYPWEVYESIRQIIEMMSNEPAKKIYWELAARANILPDEFQRFQSIVSNSNLPPNFKKLVDEIGRGYFSRSSSERE